MTDQEKFDVYFEKRLAEPPLSLWKFWKMGTRKTNTLEPQSIKKAEFALGLAPDSYYVKSDREQAEVERLESNYLVVNFGHGTIEVAEGISEDTYALMLGNGGSGVVGEDLQGDRHMTKHEMLAVLKFHNVSSIDVVLSRLKRLRQRMINHEPVEIKNDSGEVVEIITPKLKEQNHD